MDSNVQSILKKIQAKVVELDALRVPIIKESIEFAKNVTNSFMQSAVMNNPDEIKKLGADGLKPIKDEFNNIINSLDTLTRDVLEDDKVWVYKREIDLNNIEELESRNFSISGSRLPDKLDDALRSLLSPIGALLTKHKLDYSDNWKKSGNQVRYSYGLSITVGLLESAKIFSRKHQEYESLMYELKEANKVSQQKAALSFWDNI